MNQLRYCLWMLLAIPFVPVMIWQGKRIRRTIPSLPEAAEPCGVVGEGGPFRLLALGESTIAGVGVEKHADGIVGHLATCLFEQSGRQVVWKVVAKNGCTIERSLTELVPQINDFRPDLIVIGFGGNDAFACTTPRRWERGINQLIGYLRQDFGEVPVVFLNMPPIYAFPAFSWLLQTFVGGLVGILGKTLAEAAARHEGVYYCNDKILLDEWLAKTSQARTVRDFFSDGVHPSQMTYQLWAEEVCGFVVKNRMIETTLTG